MTLEQCGRCQEHWPLCSRKSTYNFWLPKSLITNSLLLTGSRSNYINSQLTHILHVIMYHMLYSYNKARGKRILLRKWQEKIHVQYCTALFKKNLHVSGPMQLKPVLFKGQLTSIFHFCYHIINFQGDCPFIDCSSFNAFRSYFIPKINSYLFGEIGGFWESSSWHYPALQVPTFPFACFVFVLYIRDFFQM